MVARQAHLAFQCIHKIWLMLLKLPWMPLSLCLILLLKYKIHVYFYLNLFCLWIYCICAGAFCNTVKTNHCFSLFLCRVLYLPPPLIFCRQPVAAGPAGSLPQLCLCHNGVTAISMLYLLVYKNNWWTKSTIIFFVAIKEFKLIYFSLSWSLAVNVNGWYDWTAICEKSAVLYGY